MALWSELKQFDLQFDATVEGNGAWASTLVPMQYLSDGGGDREGYTDGCLIPTMIGNEYGQIKGQRYYLSGIHIRFTAHVNSLANETIVDQACKIRAVLIMDTQPQGTQVSEGNCFETFGPGEDNFMAFRNTAKRGKRFRFLMEEVKILQPTVTATEDSNGSTSGMHTGDAPSVTVSESTSTDYEHSIGYETAVFDFDWKTKREILVSVSAVGNSSHSVEHVESHNIFLCVMCMRDDEVIETFLKGCCRTYYYDN
mgnify:FL=1